MSNPIRPSVLSTWTQTNTGARTQPTSGEQTTGFVPNFRPPASWHNWLFGIYADWIQWLDFVTYSANKSSTSTGATTLAAPIATFLGNPAGGTFAVAFPAAAANPGYQCSVKNISATNNLTVVVQTGDYLEGTINGTKSLPPGETMKFASDGATGYWQIA